MPSDGITGDPVPSDDMPPGVATGASTAFGVAGADGVAVKTSPATGAAVVGAGVPAGTVSPDTLPSGCSVESTAGVEAVPATALGGTVMAEDVGSSSPVCRDSAVGADSLSVVGSGSVPRGGEIPGGDGSTASGKSTVGSGSVWFGAGSVPFGFGGASSVAGGTARGISPFASDIVSEPVIFMDSTEYNTPFAIHQTVS